ncbi:hypothetical protein ACHAPQ_009901 [Fusarium lateritium]
MSEARQHWGLACPDKAAKFYICEDDDAPFMGCCINDPCGKNNGTCADDDLRATTFNGDSYADLPAQDCANSQGLDNWYTCAYTDPPFIGCCSQNACGSGCPADRIVPARLSKIAKNKDNFLSPAASSSASATASSTAEPDSGDGGLGTGAIAGIAVGAAVGGLLILVLLAWLFWWKPRQNKKQQGTQPAATSAPPAPTMTEQAYSLVSGDQQPTYHAQSPMSGYQQSFAPSPTTWHQYPSGVPSSMDHSGKLSPQFSQFDQRQSYGHFSEAGSLPQSPNLPAYQQPYQQPYSQPDQPHIPVVSEMDGTPGIPLEMSAGPEHHVQQDKTSLGDNRDQGLGIGK